MLLNQLQRSQARAEIQYRRVVKANGNQAALNTIDRVLSQFRHDGVDWA
jgi:hydrogenase maturation factor